MAMDKNIEFTINENSAPKQTNYDRIKSMSVEEMARFMAKLDECEKYCAFTKDEKCNATGTEPFVCVKGCKQWLLQEVSDEQTNR